MVLFFNKCIVVFEQEIWTLHILLMKSKFALSCLNNSSLCTSVSWNLFISAYIIFVPSGIVLLLTFGQQLIYIHTWSADYSSLFNFIYLFIFQSLQFYTEEIVLFKIPDHSRFPWNIYSAVLWLVIYSVSFSGNVHLWVPTMYQEWL